jgi:hypothetical protein
MQLKGFRHQPPIIAEAEADHLMDRPIDYILPATISQAPPHSSQKGNISYTFLSDIVPFSH